MDQETTEVIKKFLEEVFKSYPYFVKAYLFGSYAKGTNTKDSDIDIALILEKLKDDELFDKQVELMMLSSKFDLRIEPHPIPKKDFNINNPFAAEILTTGKEL